MNFPSVMENNLEQIYAFRFICRINISLFPNEKLLHKWSVKEKGHCIILNIFIFKRNLSIYSFLCTLITLYSKISYFHFKIAIIKKKLPGHLEYLFPCKMVFFIIFAREQNHPVSSEFEIEVILRNKAELGFGCRLYLEVQSICQNISFSEK